MENIHPTPETAQKKIRTLSLTGLSLAVLGALQIIGLPNFVTGIAVNAVFIFVLLYLGVRSSIFLAVLSPFGGLISGHLPAVMYPLVPVIVVGNLFLVGAYFFCQKKRLLLRVLMPSLAKAGFIYLLGVSVLKWLEIGEKVKWLVIPVLGIQFITSFGGILLGEKLSENIFPVNESANAEIENKKAD